MKINADLTKTLLEIAAKTTIDKITTSAASAIQNTPQNNAKGTGTAAEPDPADGSAEARDKKAPDAHPQEPFGHMLKGIGTQVAAAVTDGLSRQMNKKVEEIVQVAELAVERQRVAALSDMRDALEVERTKAMEDLSRTASSISNKLILSAAFVGGSLLMVVATLLLHK